MRLIMVPNWFFLRKRQRHFDFLGEIFVRREKFSWRYEKSFFVTYLFRRIFRGRQINGAGLRSNSNKNFWAARIDFPELCEKIFLKLWTRTVMKFWLTKNLIVAACLWSSRAFLMRRKNTQITTCAGFWILRAKIFPLSRPAQAVLSRTFLRRGNARGGGKCLRCVWVFGYSCNTPQLTR